MEDKVNINMKKSATITIQEASDIMEYYSKSINFITKLPREFIEDEHQLEYIVNLCDKTKNILVKKFISNDSFKFLNDKVAEYLKNEQ